MQAYQASASMFGARVVPEEIIPSSTIPRQEWDSDDASVPRSYIKMNQLEAGVPAFKIFHQVGLAGSGGAARRLIEQGGAYVNDQRIASFDQLITENDIKNMEILLRSGKKRYKKIRVE